MHRFRCCPLGLAALLAAVGSLEGCVAFSGHQLPTYTSEQLIKLSEKPAIEYSLMAYANGRETVAGLPVQQKHIEAVFGQSQMFSSVKAGIGISPYHFFITTKEEFNKSAVFLSSFLSGFTFLVVPGYAHADAIMDVDVKEGDRLLKHYQYRDDYTMWTEILLIFAMPFYWPPTVINATFDNMLMNLLHDVGRDNILQTPASTPSAS